MKNDQHVDIYIVGTGISNIDHITRQAERILRSCNEILYVDNGIGVREFLDTLCPKVTDLISESYVEDKDLLDSYKIMAARVVDAAIQKPPVAFALYGHPTVFALPPVFIRKAAQNLGLSVKVIPGISALDCIMADLKIDPLGHGLQSFEATDLLTRRYELNPELPVIIWQVGSVETTLLSFRQSKPKRFERIRDFLAASYGADHVVYAVFCSSYAMLEPEILSFKLEEMPNYADKFHNGHTLYVPPKVERGVMDREALEDALSFEHLKKITV